MSAGAYPRWGAPWLTAISGLILTEMHRHLFTECDLDSPITFTCLSLHGGRKPEYTERTHNLATMPDITTVFYVEGDMVEKWIPQDIKFAF